MKTITIEGKKYKLVEIKKPKKKVLKRQSISRKIREAYERGCEDGKEENSRHGYRDWGFMGDP